MFLNECLITEEEVLGEYSSISTKFSIQELPLQALSNLKPEILNKHKKKKPKRKKWKKTSIELSLIKTGLRKTHREKPSQEKKYSNESIVYYKII